MNENNNKSNTLLLTVIAVATLLVAVIGATFAYFTANITNTESASSLTVNSASLNIEFEDGNSSVYLAATDRIEPSVQQTPFVTKSFTLTATNDTTASMPYTLNLVVTECDFDTTQDNLKYTLEGTGVGTVVNTTTKTAIPSNIVSLTLFDDNATADTTKHGIVLGTGSFNANSTGTVHTYSLKIYFDETNTNQDVDKNKTFTGYINISTGNNAIVPPAQP